MYHLQTLIRQNWIRVTFRIIYFMKRLTFFAENFLLPKSYSLTEIHIFQPWLGLCCSSVIYHLSPFNNAKLKCRHLWEDIFYELVHIFAENFTSKILFADRSTHFPAMVHILVLKVDSKFILNCFWHSSCLIFQTVILSSKYWIFITELGIPWQPLECSSPILVS